MIISKLKRSHIIWAHVIFWTLELFIGFSYYIFSPDDIPASYYYGRIASSIVWMGAFYIAYAIFVPLSTGKGKMIQKLIPIIVIYIVYVILDTYFVRFLNIVYYESEPLAFNRYLLNGFTYISSHMIMGVVFRIAINGIRALVSKSQLEKQNLKSELALLRSQINPHFLFNTLNNMHSFTHTDPDKTAFSIIKLSEIMRYMLKEANTDKVFLEDEIEYIRSYIALQNIRFLEKQYVKLEVLGNPKGVIVAPMIFIPFVENAFKHGDKRQKELGIKVSLEVKNSEIYFEVRNLKRKIKSEEIDGKSGFGLDNLRRRLELTYPDKFSLNINDNGKEYITKLKIDLKNED